MIIKWLCTPLMGNLKDESNCLRVSRLIGMTHAQESGTRNLLFDASAYKFLKLAPHQIEYTAPNRAVFYSVQVKVPEKSMSHAQETYASFWRVFPLRRFPFPRVRVWVRNSIPFFKYYWRIRVRVTLPSSEVGNGEMGNGEVACHRFWYQEA